MSKNLQTMVCMLVIYNMCTDVNNLMHAVAPWGCMDTGGESVPKVDSGSGTNFYFFAAPGSQTCVSSMLDQYYNNNEFLERLTRKALCIFSTNTYLSKFNAYNMNTCTHTCTHTDSHTHTHTCTHTHTHTNTHTHQSHIRAIWAMRPNKRFLKRERFSRKI